MTEVHSVVCIHGYMYRQFQKQRGGRLDRWINSFVKLSENFQPAEGKKISIKLDKCGFTVDNVTISGLFLLSSRGGFNGGRGLILLEFFSIFFKLEWFDFFYYLL